ncbi:MAG: hypothetical protein M3P51_06790 [Chloroflexota bacterium]|nr:hypothetical protein [Chloroflexota bacterium]
MSLETGGTNATDLRALGGKLLFSWIGGVLQNYATDRLGSVTATTNNTSRGLTNTYRYDPWGTLVGSTGTTYNPYRYTSTYIGGATGLYQMGARCYSAGMGHFTQADPRGDSVFTGNRSEYAGCNSSPRLFQ